MRIPSFSASFFIEIISVGADFLRHVLVTWRAWPQGGFDSVRVLRSISAEVLTIAPDAYAARRVGHFGFFRPEHRYTLWREAADWIEAAE